MSQTRRDRILSLVPGGTTRVLGVARASGRLDALLRERGHWVAGIDVSEDVIAKAKQVLDRADSIFRMSDILYFRGRQRKFFDDGLPLLPDNSS